MTFFPIPINTPEAKDLAYLTTSYWVFSKHSDILGRRVNRSPVKPHVAIACCFSSLSKFSFLALPSRPLYVASWGTNNFRQHLNLHARCVLSSSSLALPTCLHSPTSFLMPRRNTGRRKADGRARVRTVMAQGEDVGLEAKRWGGKPESLLGWGMPVLDGAR